MYIHVLYTYIYMHQGAVMIIRTLYAGNYRLRPLVVLEVNKWLRLSSFMTSTLKPAIFALGLC